MHPGRKILCGHLDVTYRSRGHNLASMKACLAISWWETTKSFDLTAGSNDTIRGQKQSSVAGGQIARGWVSCRKQVWPERWPREMGGICLSFGLSDGGTEQEWVAERPRTQKGNSCGWAMWWGKRSVRPQGASTGGGRVGRGKPPTVWQKNGGMQLCEG